MNWEVVQKTIPCKWVLYSMTHCRSCERRIHIRVQGSVMTLCGKDSDQARGWNDFGDTHPEDVDAIDRCFNCYDIFERRKKPRSDFDRFEGW